jgi:hypothetical protein
VKKVLFVFNDLEIKFVNPFKRLAPAICSRFVPLARQARNPLFLLIKTEARGWANPLN